MHVVVEVIAFAYIISKDPQSYNKNSGWRAVVRII